MVPLEIFTTKVAMLTLLVCAAWQDVRYRRIPNRICLLLLALFPFYVFITRQTELLYTGPLAGGGLLAVGFACWRAGLVGGGDVKLGAALATFTGLGGLGPLLLATTLTGGLLAIVALVSRRSGWWLRAYLLASLPLFCRDRAARLLLSTADHGLHPRTATIPYGVAIAVGGAWSFVLPLQP